MLRVTVRVRDMIRAKVRVRFTSDRHSWRSDAINFLLAYCQIADLTLSPFSPFLFIFIVKNRNVVMRLTTLRAPAITYTVLNATVVD